MSPAVEAESFTVGLGEREKIRYFCRHCSAKLHAPRRYRGEKGRCGRCGKVTRIPSSSTRKLGEAKPLKVIMSKSQSEGSVAASLADASKIDPSYSMSRRMEQTLECLLRGDSESEVALELELSQYTVHDYVKSLYKHFRVNSRRELLAKCFSAPNGENDLASAS